MTIFTRDGLINMLRNNIVTVTFTKVNGEERVMKCTLRSELIPNAPTRNGELVVERKTASNNVSVWDVDASGWRSFRVENVKNISMGN
jgi:WYL_2, Sm-like SH3 beta-barrel fold